MFNSKENTMKKLVQTITIIALFAFLAVGNISAQEDLTYIDEAPIDSSHMEQTINLGEEVVEEESNQSAFLFGALAVIILAGVVVVVIKKKKK